MLIKNCNVFFVIIERNNLQCPQRNAEEYEKQTFVMHAGSLELEFILNVIGPNLLHIGGGHMGRPEQS